MNSQSQGILESFLAGLLDDKESRLALMGSDIVNSEMLPDTMKFHRAVLQGIERCDEKNVPPTVDNVTLLSLSHDEHMHEKIEKLAQIQGAREMVRANAVWIRDWLSQEALAEAVKEIDKLAKVDYGNSQEKQGMMIDALLDVEVEGNRQAYTRLELITLLEDEQRKRVERKEKGQALGPILFLEGLREAIPVLARGDVTLITAPPKAGKTTTGMLMAEINAYDNDTDVLWLLLETGATTIEERFLARELLIPSKRLRDGTVDLTKGKFKKAHDTYKEQQQYHWDEHGRIYLEYVAGDKMSTIRSKIRVYKRMADIRNRPLLVIIDYLQRIPKPGNKTETEGLALISNMIKDLAQTYETHILLFSQESFSQDGKQKGDSRAHGSNTPIFIAQSHIALRVLNSTVSVLISDEQGNVFRDACGGERYWQYEGRSKRQCVMRYDILRTNDNDTGQAYCAVEGGLFQVIDLSRKDVTPVPFMQDQIDHFDQDLNAAIRQLL